MSDRAASDVRLLVDCRCELGEGVQWNAQRRRVYWTDIKGHRLWSCDADGKRVKTVDLDAALCSFAFSDDGRILGAFEDGLSWLDPFSGKRTLFEPYEPGRDGVRMNDGRLDRQGRFVVGGMDEAGRTPTTPIWVVNRGIVSAVLDDVAVANSIAFSPEGRSMYLADTPTGEIRVYDYDPLAGQIDTGATFLPAGSARGLPDGSAVDVEGAVWNARFGGGCIVRVAPDGTVVREIDVPVPNVTCVAFGGPRLHRLFITTARIDMADDALAAAPQAGALYAVDLDVPGVPDGTYRR